MLALFVIVAAFLADGYYSLPNVGHNCPGMQVPAVSNRGVNRLNTSTSTPLFRLEITVRSTGDAALYKVDISAENEDIPFSDAAISIASKGPCGTGSLTFDPNDFSEDKHRVAACPRLLFTSSKAPMDDLPSLTWARPSCGCVHFRAMVTSFDSAYYADGEEVENGPLSQTVCVHPKSTRELYLNTLCQVNERYSVAEIISRPSFLQRHQLETRWMDKHGLEMGLELRRSDNKLCCSKSQPEAKLACFDDSRRRRVDRFCEDGYPDIPLTSFRLGHMRDRERSCCFLLGEHRYRCFAENSDLVHGSSTTVLDFSQDETDPVNDLAEFASLHDKDVLKSIANETPEEKKQKDDKVDKDNGDDDEDDDDDSAPNGDKTSSNAFSNRQTTEKTSAKPAAMVEVSDSRTGTDKGLDHIPVSRGSQQDHGHHKMATGRNGLWQTSAERRNKGRSSAEFRRGRPYTSDGRPTSGERKRQRGASGERQRGASLERQRYTSKAAGNLGGYSRRADLSRERQLLSSIERKKRIKDGSSAIIPHDWPEVDGLNIDEQGGKSVVDLTMDKIQRQMHRLILRQHCCEQGATAGSVISGWVALVRRECADNGNKYIEQRNLRSGVTVCRDQFIKCCNQMAVSGPSVSSSEFRERQFLFANNLKNLGPVKGSSFDRHEDEWDPYPVDDDDDDRETPEAYERDSDQRFRIMREDPVPSNYNDYDDEKDGPKRFDEVDNDGTNDDNDDYNNGDDDILDRKETATSAATRTTTGSHAVEEFKDTDSVKMKAVDESEEGTLGLIKGNTKQGEKDEYVKELGKVHHNNPENKERHSHALSREHNSNQISKENRNSQVNKEQHNHPVRKEHHTHTVSKEHHNKPLNKEHHKNQPRKEHNYNSVSKEHHNNIKSEEHHNHPVNKENHSHPANKEHHSHLVPKEHSNHSVPKEHHDQQEDYTQQIRKEHHDQQVPKEHHDQQVPKEHHNHAAPTENHDQQIPNEHHYQKVAKEHHTQQVPKEHHNHSAPKERHDQQVPKERHDQQVPKERHDQQVPKEHYTRQKTKDSLDGSHDTVKNTGAEDGASNRFKEDDLPRQRVSASKGVDEYSVSTDNPDRASGVHKNTINHNGGLSMRKESDTRTKTSGERKEKLQHTVMEENLDRTPDLVESARSDDSGRLPGDDMRMTSGETKGRGRYQETTDNLDRVSDLVDSRRRQNEDWNKHREDATLATSSREARRLQKHTERQDNLDRASDIFENSEKQDGDLDRRSEEDSLLVKAFDGRSREVAKTPGGRSREPSKTLGGRSREMTKISGGRSRESRNNWTGGQSKAGRFSSRENRRSSSSRRASQERRQYPHLYQDNRHSYKHAPLGKIGTQDSQEMAAAHTRKFMGTLDSKEMVDAHRQTRKELREFSNDSPRYSSSQRRQSNRKKGFY